MPFFPTEAVPWAWRLSLLVRTYCLMEPFNVLRRILKSLRTMEPNKTWDGASDSSSCRVITGHHSSLSRWMKWTSSSSCFQLPDRNCHGADSRVARERAEEEEEKLGVIVTFVVPVPGFGDSPLTTWAAFVKLNRRLPWFQVVPFSSYRVFLGGLTNVGSQFLRLHQLTQQCHTWKGRKTAQKWSCLL